MLGPAELRLVKRVSVVCESATVDPTVLMCPCYAFLHDEDEVVLQVQVPVSAEWRVHVNNDGDAMAHWIGDREDAPGHAEWMALEGNERLLDFLENFGSTPTDRFLPCNVVSFDGVFAWEICLFVLQPLGFGHLIVPMLPSPALESL